MGKVPGSRRVKPEPSSQAAALVGPEGEAPLPAPEAGPAGAGVSGVEGSPVNGLSPAAECMTELVIPATRAVVARLRCGITDVLSDVPGSLARSRSVISGDSAVSAKAESTSVEEISFTGRPVSAAGKATGKGSTVAAVSSTMGCRTGSRTGRASASGGATVSARSPTTESAATATGMTRDETVSAGTTLPSTGTEATIWSAVPATVPTIGCTSPESAGNAGEMAAWSGAAAPVSGAERDETEDVTPPRSEPDSADESAIAGEEESVSQAAVAAPARRMGRSARHGDRT